jgi:hypothetical protein
LLNRLDAARELKPTAPEVKLINSELVQYAIKQEMISTA